MKFVADLHIHSKYSRATSRDMVLETLAPWAKVKGIGLLATGAFCALYVVLAILLGNIAMFAARWTRPREAAGP